MFTYYPQIIDGMLVQIYSIVNGLTINQLMSKFFILCCETTQPVYWSIPLFPGQASPGVSWRLDSRFSDPVSVYYDILRRYVYIFT